MEPTKITPTASSTVSILFLELIIKIKFRNHKRTTDKYYTTTEKDHLVSMQIAETIIESKIFVNNIFSQSNRVNKQTDATPEYKSYIIIK